MQSFQWSDEFLTDLPEIDRQHSRLIDVINKFGEFLVKDELLFDDVEAVLKELIDYSNYHFKEEEEMFFAVGVDSRHRKEHCYEHKYFLDEITSIEISIVKNNTSMSYEKAQSLFKFLTNWLAYHILESDKYMSRQVKSIESGVKPNDAYIAENHKKDITKEPLLVALHGLFQEVSKRNKELMELNETLEIKVAERTRELYEANRHLEKLSVTDVLTKLPNRRYAMQQLKKIWEQSSETGKPIACMMVDADGFKQINDTYGHDAGDVVLTVLAKELVNAVRTDDIVCRLGGDEFLIICSDTNQNGVLHIANIIQQTINKLRIPAGEGIWHGSVSIGVAARTPAMEIPDALVKSADDGVFAAKQAGKNCVRCIYA